MRPKKLTISAWGPYPGEAVIDFDTIAGDGLFLITGPTGSGKTTLFDALSYALYGAVSGKIREKISLRSDFAKPETPTFVSLEFSHRGKLYTIVRNPKYSRPKKRGTGVIDEPEKACLLMPDGREYYQLTQVNAELIALLGLNHEQFKQVSMIAQGEFMELLTADSSKRVEIFRSIFGTGIFNRIQLALGEQSRRLEGEIRELNHRMEEAAAGIIAEENKELLELLGAQAKNYQSVAAALKEDILSAKAAGKKTQEQLDCVSERLQAMTLMEEKLQRIKNELKAVRGRLDSHKCRREELLRGKPELDKDWKNKDRLVKNIQALNTRLAQCGDYIRWCEDYSEKARIFEGLLKELEALEQRKADFSQKEMEWQEKIGKCQDYIKGLGDIEGDYVQAKNEAEKRNGLLEESRRFLEKCRQCENQKKDYEKYQKAYSAADEVFQKAEQRFKAAQRASMQAAAGLLAKDLREGQPCPVCGSASHPRLAPVALDVPSEEELKGLERHSERCREKMMAAFNEAVGHKGQYEAMERELWARLEPKENSFTLDEARSLGETLLEERSAAYDESLGHLKELEKTRTVKDKTVKSLEKFQSGLEELLVNKARLTEYYTKTAMDVQIARGRMEEAKNHLLSESGEAEIPKVSALEKEKQLLEQQIFKAQAGLKALEQAHEQLYTELASNEALIAADGKRVEQLLKELNEAYEKYPGGFGAALEGKAVDELRAAKKKLEDCKDVWTLRISHNCRAYESLAGKLKARERLSVRYGYLKDLDNAARGNNSMKLTFEQYVLGAYFDEVLEAANLRLNQMSRGRYAMLRVDRVLDYRKTNSLDIEVMDYYTGKKRSVRTLSGGESFNAALSLALGLSDVIQSHAGGIEIEALFIDEGFGSLDEASLQSAVDTLMTVTSGGHMTGIISHVQELKERIRHQVIIEKERSGSYIKAVL